MAAAAPIVTYLGGVLVAVDAETGARVWTRPLGKPVLRVVLAWRHVFVAVPAAGPTGEPRSEILWFDVHTGEPRGERSIGFAVTAALARGTHVYFAGARGAVAMAADGTELFRVDLDGAQLVARDAGGRDLWREATVGEDGVGVLLLGDAVAQPDFDT
jgi:hypothetical protein